jgi:hypothetical protein
MRIFSVEGEIVGEGTTVVLEPYPHIVLGEGGHKRATWIPLGKNDWRKMIAFPPCPIRGSAMMDITCNLCGVAPSLGVHPNEGNLRPVFEGGNVGRASIKEASVIVLKSNGYLIVAPRNGDDNRVLVLWRVSSGFRGSASITAGEGVMVIASDSSWHSGRGNLGETAEMLAILKPGQELRASRSGRRVQGTRAKLIYDGKTISTIFGGEEMEVAMTDEVVEGEYI